MKKFIILLNIFLFALFPKVVNANTINSIDIDIFIDKDGNAKVTEVWECTSDQLTEYFHRYNGMGSCKIENLKVSDETGTIYELLPEWNSKNLNYNEYYFDSIDNGEYNLDKNFKCGLEKVLNSQIIFFGIDKLGKKTYTIEYDMINFVINLNDSQMIERMFFGADGHDLIENLNVQIKSDFDFNKDIEAWEIESNNNFTCEITNGIITLKSIDAVDEQDYIGILVKIPQNLFNCQTTSNLDFDYFFRHDIRHYTTKEDIIMYIVLFIVSMTLVGFCLYIPLKSLYGKRTIYGVSDDNLNKVNNAPYYKNIPCDGDIYKSYYISYKYGLMREPTDFLGVIFLKWLKNGNITIDVKYNNILKKNKLYICFNTNDYRITNEFENQLYNWMLTASKDGILKIYEFEIWCRKNYLTILRWFYEVLKSESMLYDDNSTKYNEKINDESSTLLEDAINLSGLKKYLNAYLLNNIYESMDVEWLEEYIIYAQLFGKGKEIIKRFKKIYPNLINESIFASYDNIKLVISCAQRGINSAAIQRLN